jgi:hypothetical protein
VRAPGTRVTETPPLAPSGSAGYGRPARQ